MSAVAAPPAAALPRPANPRRAAPARAHRSPSGRAIVVLGILGLLVVLPTALPLQPNRVDLDAVLQPPSLVHVLGTDENGRDGLARLLVGARATLGIGVGGAALAVILGTVIGALAGYLGGAIDAVAMRCVDLALAFPSLFAILLFSAVFPAGPAQLIVLIGVTGWMPVARLVRGGLRELVTAPYVEAARALGANHWRIVLRHLLPNTAGVVFVAALLQLNRAILTEATISFLGLGIQPPDPTWGNLLIGAQNFLYTAPWLAVAPGLAITVTLLAVYSLGISRALSPRATAGRATS